jgi:2-hydroxy-3-keto-5-methylthiopentenyl-1-phosphate phosphatase
LNRSQKIAVLCDFDGTIVDVDIGELVLKKFGKGDWHSLDIKLERGEISLEQCLIEQYAMIKVPRKQILEMLSHERIRVRRNFAQLVQYCKKSGFEFVVATGGIDFCISHILRTNGLALNSALKIYSGKTRVTANGLTIRFPKMIVEKSLNFKEDLVNHYHKLSYRVAYIGDGSSDYLPAKKADLIFTVEKSKLSKMCTQNNIPHFDFSDFKEVIMNLEAWVKTSQAMRHL